MNDLLSHLALLPPTQNFLIYFKVGGVNSIYLQLEPTVKFTWDGEAITFPFSREDGIDVLSLLVDRILDHTLRSNAISIPFFLWCSNIEALMTNPNSPISFLQIDSDITPEVESSLNKIMDTKTCRLYFIFYRGSLESDRRRMRFEKRQKKLLPLQNRMFALLHSRGCPMSPARKLPQELVRMLSGYLV